MFFEPDFLPGYFWSFPLADGRANIGFGIQRGGELRTQDMKALWPDLLSRPHVRELLGPDAVAAEPHRAWPIPARIDTMPTGVGRTVFVGDAVAACDPLTGEGIGQALLTGAPRGRDDPPPDRSAPRRATRATAPRSQRTSTPTTGCRCCSSAPCSTARGARAAVFVAGLNPWTRRNFARWLFEDYPRGIALTPRRWRRGLMSGPGAFR